MFCTCLSSATAAPDLSGGGKRAHEASPAALPPPLLVIPVQCLNPRFPLNSKQYPPPPLQVTPYPLLLFGGTIAVQLAAGSVTIDGWIRLACVPKV